MRKSLLALSLLITTGLSAQTDATSYIKNASFEQGTRYWQHNNIAVQDNNSFGEKKGSIYLERWVENANVGTVSLEQALEGVQPGRYTLTAGALCIKQGQEGTAQKGAVLFACDQSTPVTSSGQYKVTFTVLDPVVSVGFSVAGTSANWVAVDNFRLTCDDTSADVLAEELQHRIDQAKMLTDSIMSAEAMEALTTAIAAAESEMQTISLATVADVAAQLRQAVATAEKSVLDTQLAALIAEGSGTSPRITLHNWARGNSAILVRATIQPVTVPYKGICYATHPEPTYEDACTDETVPSQSNIYIARNLKPGTVYYVRPYAISPRGKLTYGTEIMVPTLPKAKVTYDYDNGGNAIQNARIWSALDDAAYYYNTYTSIVGYNTSCHFGPETPTADCSYGGWMRVGPNEGYQRTGTIMHEMSHGVGVGTHGVWNDWGTPMRADHGTGAWLGDRASKILGFIDNTTSGTLWGDNTHMWPYGINGSWEDTGEEWLYISNAMIVQAVCEDALPPVNGFSLPYYAFDCKEGEKYYLKNSKSDYGRESKFVTMTANGTLQLTEMSSDEAIANDSAAWYVDFHADTHYYSLRNVATGKYFAYKRYGSNGFGTSPSSSAKTLLQLHMGRSDVKLTNGKKAPARGYYIIFPQSSLNPPTFTPLTASTLGSVNFILQDEEGRHQRWMILTADQARTVNAAYDATGIDTLPEASDPESDAALYDLSGRRVEKAIQKGVYVQQGRKVLVH